MPKFELDRRSSLKLAATVGAMLLFLGFYIEDWGRDFTSHEAELSAEPQNARNRRRVNGASGKVRSPLFTPKSWSSQIAKVGTSRSSLNQESAIRVSK